MVPEAPLERGRAWRGPAGEGWFVVNARDARGSTATGSAASRPVRGRERQLRAARDQLGDHPSWRAERDVPRGGGAGGLPRALRRVPADRSRGRSVTSAHGISCTAHRGPSTSSSEPAMEPCLVLGVGARREGSRSALPGERASLFATARESRRRRRTRARRTRGFRSTRPIPCPAEFLCREQADLGRAARMYEARCRRASGSDSGVPPSGTGHGLCRAGHGSRKAALRPRVARRTVELAGRPSYRRGVCSSARFIEKRATRERAGARVLRRRCRPGAPRARGRRPPRWRRSLPAVRRRR